MEEIKAIDTVYNGHKFRSRLEARYAIFMKCMNIKWIYELEGYQLPSGWYLPDFYFSEFEGGCFAEVKLLFTDAETQLCKELCETIRRPVLMLEGIPSIKSYNCFYYEETKNKAFIIPGMINLNERKYGRRMYVWPESYSDKIGNITDVSYYEDIYRDAIDKANMARFEFADKILR